VIYVFSNTKKLKKKIIILISILIFALSISFIFRYGGKYEFNPYSIEIRERRFIDFRFGEYEISSWLYSQNPSWLKDRLDKLGYNNYSKKDCWVHTGVWYLGKPATFNSLIDIKGPANSKCFYYRQKGEPQKALLVWQKELDKIKQINENKGVSANLDSAAAKPE